MKLLTSLCFMFLVPVSVIGQTPSPTLSPADYCGGVGDFGECLVFFNCSGNSRCSCKDEKPFCRCNSAINEWFLGDNCQQKWTLITFALVASLPGLALAVVVGVTVQLVNYFNKPAKAPKDTHSSKHTNQPQVNHYEDTNGQDGAYSNLVFAGDMPSRPTGPYVQPVRESFPMAGRPSSPYSHQQNGMLPPIDRPTQPAPGIQRTPTMNPGSQPYNMATGMTQPVGNPYGRSQVRNPYSDRGPPADRYDDYRPPQPVSRQNSVMGGYPGPAPTFSAPGYDSRAQFPRAHMGRPM